MTDKEKIMELERTVEFQAVTLGIQRKEIEKHDRHMDEALELIDKARAVNKGMREIVAELRER